MDRGRAQLALLCALPVALPMLFLLAGDLRALTDPCMEWGMDAGRPGGAMQAIPSSGPCSSGVSGTSQTKAEYVAVTLAVKGTATIGLALGTIGLLRDRSALVVSASWVLFGLSIPLFLGIAGYPVLLSSAFYLLATREMAPLPKGALLAARALAALVLAGWVTQLVGAAFSGIAVFLGVTLVAGLIPATMAFAVFAPRRVTSA